ncbi:threonine/serine exporter family protein [Bradyrhizobium sp. 6(2017)]|nr:threonine/serine exporter family protein [Bradyrhizobium sp. 6(2017)]
MSGFSHNPLIQPLCAAFIAGIVAAVASRFQLPVATALVAFCPCMVLVPGPHILNGAIDLARTRIALGIARLAYAGVIVLLICAGGLFGFMAVGANLSIAGSSPPIPLAIDVIAAGCAVASFGTFFSMPWRLLPFPIAVGMLAHAARWAVISVAGGSAPAGALVACTLVGILTTPVADRRHLPFAALAFSAVVSLMPGFFLFNAATGLVELLSIGPSAPPALLTGIVASGTTAFLIVMAMTFGLILPRMLYERFLPSV